MKNNIIKEAKTISIIIPTRKRPGNLTRLIDSIIATASIIENVELCARVDSDDMETIEVLHGFSNVLDVKISIGTRQSCHGYYWNDAWNIATGDVLQMSSDDFVYHTKNWDIEILKEINKYEDKILFVFGNDGIQKGKIGTHFFIHKRWAERLGYFVQMKTNVFYHDTWNDKIAGMIGRRCYREDLYFEHKHWSITKDRAWDQVTKDAHVHTGQEDRIWRETHKDREGESEKLKELLYEKA